MSVRRDTANDVLGCGSGRAKKFMESMGKTVNEMSDLILDSAKDDPDMVYAKEKIDQRLRQICGDEFKPWEDRYPK